MCIKIHMETGNHANFFGQCLNPSNSGDLYLEGQCKTSCLPQQTTVLPVETGAYTSELYPKCRIKRASLGMQK